MRTTDVRKTKTGIVVSNKMAKTIVVKVEERRAHSKYGKTVNFSNKFHAHDEKNEAKMGDEVVIMETRPLSKTKCWRLVQIKKKNAKALVAKVEINASNVTENI